MSDPNMSICDSEENESPLNAVSDRPRRPAQGTPQQWENFKMEIRQLITTSFTSQKEELRQLSTRIKEIQETNKNIEISLNYVTTQNEELKQKIISLEERSKIDKENIMLLEDKLDDLQLGYRKTNFEIKGVPRKESETKQDLIDMVVKLSETVDCKINKTNIKDIYRVRGKKPEHKNTPIVVETGSVLLKTDLMKMAKSFNVRNKSKLCAKHLGMKSHADTPIFISENLTPKASRLHFLARDLAKSRGYKFVWTSYGKIYVRKSEQSAIIMIKTEQQENVLRECLDRGIEDSIFTNKSKLHLTMGAMCLRSDEERRYVSKLLYEAKEKVLKPILQGHLPLMIRVKGLAYMENDPNKINVLYAQVSEEAEESRGVLQRMADELVQFYTKFGYMERDHGREQVRLHVTLINSKYRKLPSTVNSSGDVKKTGKGKETKRRENFNGTNILEKFSEYDFGVTELDELHISRISSRGRDGYYEPLHVINLL